VPAETISKFGVVSEETALSMVRGLKECSGADVCVSVTGIAGPSGGTAETPVGTVYIGFDICGRQFVCLPELWKLSDLGRDNIRRCAAAFAFDTIEKILMEARTD
jgi:nicotinamide-nucleotide amidase